MKKLLVFLSLLTVVGCSSTPTAKHYYQLNSDYQPQDKEVVQTVDDFIWIAPVNIASFLNKEGLVYQTDEFEFITANNNLWASPLVGQLQDLVVQDLTLLLPNRLVSSAPITTPKTTIKLFIDGFHGSYKGEVMIKGYWVIIDAKGKMVRKNFDYQLAQTTDGYGAIVETLSQGWKAEMQDLVQKITF